MISVRSLEKSFGARTLFADVDLELLAGHRYGLVGANGSGKTTFLKILAGDEAATSGDFSLPKRARVGVLRQDRFMDDAERTVDVAMRGDEEVFAALRRREETEDADELAAIEDVLAARDGYSLRARAGAVLEGLGIETAAHERPLGTLSGGFKLRVLLAQVLLAAPDALLLDEPTNHLDILSIRWLEKFLAGYRGCAVVISHDARFLENVVTDVLDVDYETITIYPGTWAAFRVEKEAARVRAETAIERAEKAIEHKMAFVERFGAKNTKARQAQSRLKQVEKIAAKLEDMALAPSSRRAPRFRFEPERPSGRDVLDVVGASKRYGDKQVLDGVTLKVRRGEKVAVIGPNGVGKSTLLKIAIGDVAPDAGTATWGHEVRVGYFAQDHKEVLRGGDETPLTFLWSILPTEPESKVRAMLGMMLLEGDEVKKSTAALSGGEAARLVFAAIAARKPNVLVLDEPTNHLDLESIDALVAALRAYEGTILFVSHDRSFVEALATRVVEITKSGPRDFPGTYAEYLAKLGDDHLDGDVALAAKKRERASSAGDAPPSSWEEQKARKNRARALEARRDKVTAEIDAAEARRRAIQELYASDGFFARTPPDEVQRIDGEDKALVARLDALLVEWEQIEAELAALTAASARPDP